MDANRYDELFKEVKRWVFQARRLHFAGDTLTEPTQQHLQDFTTDRIGAAQQTPSFLNKAENFRALSDARALLYGLAIENAAKAKQIATEEVCVENGEPKGLRTDHNILEHVKQVGACLNKEEEEFLNLLSYQVKTLSKYPIAKNLKAQNEFTGRCVGARREETEMVRKIIHRVLGDPKLIVLYDNGNTEKKDA